MRRSPRPRQLELPAAPTWGGRRRGAGRKPGPRPRTLHRRRPWHDRRQPVHLTLRALPDVAGLRGPEVFPALCAAFVAAQRPSFRLVHFSVQDDHVHLVIEAMDARALSSGTRGLTIRAARAVNRVLGRRGPVWDGRYHRRDLASPREVRAVLVYVLGNGRKHRRLQHLDPCSSAAWFDGWATSPSPRIRRCATPAAGW
ncbi:MAG TPA: hypothetical protein VGQ83_02835, partial [Polyangia bacterium]